MSSGRSLLAPSTLGWVSLACLSALAAGCGATPARITIPDSSGPVTRSAEDLARAHPLAEGQNIRPVLLASTLGVSYHFVQIRDREAPHVHAEHDLIVTLISGQGTLNVADQAVSMATGDLAVIPRGERHFFVNTGPQPAAAFVTFMPPHDGTDSIPVD